MIVDARHFRRPTPTIVSWRVGPVTQPDSLRTGTLVRVEGERALVKPSEEAAERWMDVADLEGVPVQGQRLVPAPLEPDHVRDLPAPHAQSIELLELLDRGVEIEAGMHTVLGPVLEQLQAKGYVVAAGQGRWTLTPRARELVGEVSHG